MQNDPKKYFAFISYKREDEEWGIWLQHELEYYHLPASLNGRDDLPKMFRPIFRDVDELKAGNLPNQLREALRNSANLIVICSPHSAKSEWVNQEIADFIEIGKQSGVDNIEHIFPFIVDGTPHAANPEQECFPRQLLSLQKMEERIGGNINESGRDKAFVKVIAGMLPNVEFSELWDRYEHDKAEDERLKREERERFLRMQSRFVAEKVGDISDDSALAQLLSLAVLPKDLEEPDRPYVIEAEHALRQAYFGQRIVLHGHTVNIVDVAFSPDGKLIASIAESFAIKIWERSTGKLLLNIDSGHPFGQCITFTPDNRCVTVVFGDDVLASWEISTGKRVMALDLNDFFDTEDHAIVASSITYNPSGSQIAISSLEGDVCILDFENDTTSAVCLDDSVRKVIYSPNGQYLLATTDKGFVLWDLENDANIEKSVDEEIQDLVDNTQAIFSSDSKRMAFMAATPVNCQIMIWDIQSLELIQTIEWKSEINEEAEESIGNIISIAFSADGNDIVSALNDGVIQIWNIQSNKIKACYILSSVWIKNAFFDTTGRYVGLGTADNNIIIADTYSNYAIKAIRDKPNLTSAALSPDGSRLITGAGMRDEEGKMSLWDVKSNRCLKTLSDHEDFITSVAYSPDGKLIASASADGTVLIYDAENGHQTLRLDVETVADGRYAFVYASFSPDSKRIATGISNGHMVFWDVKDGHVIQDIETQGDLIFSFDYSPDGSLIAAGSISREAKVWNVQSGKLVHSYTGHTNAITAVTISPDNSHIVAGSEDKTIICWNVQDGSVVWKKDVRDNVRSVAYSRDGRYIVATITNTSTPIIVLDACTGEMLVNLYGPMSEQVSTFFSPDDRTIISVGKSAIYWWSFPPLSEIMATVKEDLKNRQLTTEEKRRYFLE